MKIFISILIGLTILSCSDDETQSNCDFNTIVSDQQFANAPSDNLIINELSIDENCLKINFSSSGCSGDTWEIQLISSEDIAESDPPQRTIRLSLKNEELCEAFITQEYTFDIANLQTGSNSVQLNFTNSDQRILYEY